MNAYDIIKKPLLTEKSYADIQGKKYWFIVDKRATKVDVKNAVEEIFKVKVAKVTTAVMPGKPKTHKAGKKKSIDITTSEYKKACVILTKESKAIEFFESLS
jgi:large subunit ribosomal protein L23